MNRFTLSRSKGFTLVETMVAIAILTVAIAEPLYAAERTAAAAYAAKDELAASYLAQEGIEYVRAMRDDSFLADYLANAGNVNLAATAWNDFLNGGGSVPTSVAACRGAGKSCALDPTQNIGLALTACASGGCGALYINSNNIYTLASANNTATPFTRSITFADQGSAVDQNGNPLAERVTSTVTWKTDNIPYSITVSDTITPWQ